MATQIQRTNSSSGGGAHLCRKCGWPFPKPHPSSRHRRAHKKVCGTIEGYSKVAYGDETVSDDDGKGETLIDGSKSTRRGGSEEEMFADAVTEFAEVREPGNVAIGGNLYPPGSANGARAPTPERERAGVDTPLQQNLSGSSVDSARKSEEVANEEHFVSDGKINGLEKSEDANEDTGRRLETFTSCNDRFYNMVEGSGDRRTEIGETADGIEALQGPKSAEEPSVEKKVEKGQQNVILTDAGARDFLDDIDSLAKSMKGDLEDSRIHEGRDAVQTEDNVLKNLRESEAGNDSISGTDDGDLNFVKENLSESALIDRAEAERKVEDGSSIASLESEDIVPVGNSVQKGLQESEADDSAISGTAGNADSMQSSANTKERDLDVRVDSDTEKRANVGSNGETRSIEENEGVISGLTAGDVNLTKEEEAVSTFDNVRADASSQTNSPEGNWGSVSAATETESLPPQPPAKVQTPVLPPESDDDKPEVSGPSSIASLVKSNEDESGQNQGPTEAQTPPGSKKNEEIGAEKQHMPLKSFLGESSPPPRNIPAKEWNSPARYPTNIKREKSKGRSRAWVPFICCSSARTS